MPSTAPTSRAAPPTNPHHAASNTMPPRPTVTALSRTRAADARGRRRPAGSGSCSPEVGVADAGPRARPRLQPSGRDDGPADLAEPVAALRQSLDRGVDVADTGARRSEQRLE